MWRNERAVSPVVGVALLIAITVILAVFVGGVLFDVGVGPAGEPETTLSFTVEYDQDGEPTEILLVHEGGETLYADETVVIDSTGEELEPGLDADMTAGDSSTIVSTDEYEEGELEVEDIERISVVWQDPGSDSEQILATFRP